MRRGGSDPDYRFNRLMMRTGHATRYDPSRTGATDRTVPSGHRIEESAPVAVPFAAGL